MRTTDRLWIAVTFAGGISAVTLLPLTQDASYLAPAWVLLAVLAAVAIGAERLRMSKPLAILAQVMLALVMFVMLAAGFGRQDLPWWQRLVPLLHAGYDHIRVTTIPMPSNEGVQLIFVMLIVLLSLMAGVLADALERPSYTLAPLLALYLVPAISLRTDVNLVSFLAVVGGYLVILFADGLNTERSWTRNIRRDSAGRRRAGGVWRVAVMVATPALVGAVVLGLLLPTLPTTFFESLRPNGTGPIEMVDPQVDLRRNLEQPVNREVLTYTTSKPDGVYLRQTTLSQINSQGWAQTQVSLRQGTIGGVPGVPHSSGDSRQTQIQIGDLRSMYLPTPYAPRAQSAPGEWSWDPVSLMVIATGPDRNRATEGLRYNVESWDIVPDGAALSQAVVGPPEGALVTMEVPSDVPPTITELTTKVTAGYQQPALKAAAIQAFLRASDFRYDVQGTGGDTTYQAIENFLFRTKTGYCVHYAGSMALMARIAGIPSRVAVGFLPGQQRDGRWTVTAHDMHAWPELYFEGFGWVRFEPTPSVASTPPPWTLMAPNQPSADPTVGPTEPQQTQPTPETPSAETSSTPEASQQPQQTQPSSTSWAAVVGIVAITGLLVILALTPMLVRILRRRSRLSGIGDPHQAVTQAWDEVRDTWLDLGHSWPHGSPRVVGNAVARQLSDDASRGALQQVVATVERSRYSRAFTDAGKVGTQAATLVKGMGTAVSWDTALMARFLPRSLRMQVRQWYDSLRAQLRRQVGQLRRPSRPMPQAAPRPRDDSAYRRPVSAGRR